MYLNKEMYQKTNYKNVKFTEHLHHNIAIILQKMDNLKMRHVTITRVVVNKDRTSAVIYWTNIDTNEITEIKKLLTKAIGFVRTQLAHALTTYTVPQIRFEYDISAIEAEKIEQIFNKLSNKDEQ